jgi:hypothetical protein
VEADVDQLAEAGRDIAISMGEGVAEDGGDQVDGVIDDARVALKLVTKSVIDIERETYPAARSIPCRSSCWRPQTTDTELTRSAVEHRYQPTRYPRSRDPSRLLTNKRPLPATQKVQTRCTRIERDL